MQDKVYEIIDEIDDVISKRINELKKEILSNDKVLSILKKFEESKELYEKYNDKTSFTNAKKELLNNDILNEYIKLQNEINMITLHINSKINEITSIGGKNEDNKW